MIGRSLSVLAQEADPDALADAFSPDGALTAQDWATAGIVLVAGVIASRLVKRLIQRVVGRRSDAAVADLVGRLVAYTLVMVALIYALEQIGVRVGPLLGALGIAGIALAFALKDILENFVAGLMLQFRRPFSYGDQIVSGDVEGTVAAIDARSVTVLSPDGETVHLPSSQVITGAIVNHTERGTRRTSVPIGVAYGSDLDLVLRVFRAAVDELDEVYEDPEAEILLVGFGDSSIDLVARVWHAPTIADHWRTQHAVAHALDRACRDHDIEIPFPQRVLRSAE